MGEVERDMFPGYEIYEVIGAGGGGSVFKAYHKNLEKDVVIKKLHDRIKDEQQQKAEAYILKNLRHTYLPQVFDYITKDNCAYTVMDYIPGDSLGNYLKAGYTFTGKQVFRYAKELCEVVDYLHSQKIPVIHGDIKPDNIMLTPDGHICLIDFNISGISEGGVAYTDGYTPGYSAPEQYYQFKEIVRRIQEERANGIKEEIAIKDDEELTSQISDGGDNLYFDDKETDVLVVHKDGVHGTPVSSKLQVNNSETRNDRKIRIDKRSDVYSIATTIYHLYSGKRYVNGQNEALASNTSEAFVHILNKALSENPDARYQDAGQMLLAFTNIHKSDKQYKGLLAVQFAIRAILLVMLVVGCLLIFSGRNKMESEKEEKYDKCIKKMSECIDEGDEKEFNKLYNEAIQLYPNKLDAYYNQALFIYYNGDKEETLEYIDEILNNSEFYSQDNISNVYYIQAECFLELDMYKESDKSFKNAISYDSGNARFYTDDAIALARLGKIDEARKVLDKAEKMGVSDAPMSLAKGEIALADGDYEDARESFMECIDDSDEDYDMLRAYVMYSKTYDYYENSEDDIRENLELIDEGIGRLPKNMQGMLLERKAAVAIKAAEVYKNSGYELIAIEALDTVIDNKQDSIDTYLNKIILYESIEDFDKAWDSVEEAKDKYPDNYRVYLRASTLELHYQGTLDRDSRDYSKFEKYYDKTMECYEDKKKGQGDAEIQYLKDMYDELSEMGWL